MTNEFKRNNQRRWTTLWDRPNQRVLILGAPESTEMWWDFVVVDDSASVPGVYDLARQAGWCACRRRDTPGPRR